MKIKNNEDTWSAKKAKIEDLASEQTSADIAMVEATRSFKLAESKLAEASARKTTAEKKLATYRQKLGE